MLKFIVLLSLSITTTAISHTQCTETFNDASALINPGEVHSSTLDSSYHFQGTDCWSDLGANDNKWTLYAFNNTLGYNLYNISIQTDRPVVISLFALGTASWQKGSCADVRLLECTYGKTIDLYASDARSFLIGVLPVSGDNNSGYSGTLSISINVVNNVDHDPIINDDLYQPAYITNGKQDQPFNNHFASASLPPVAGRCPIYGANYSYSSDVWFGYYLQYQNGEDKPEYTASYLIQTGSVIAYPRINAIVYICPKKFANLNADCVAQCFEPIYYGVQTTFTFNNTAEYLLLRIFQTQDSNDTLPFVVPPTNYTQGMISFSTDAGVPDPYNTTFYRIGTTAKIVAIVVPLGVCFVCFVVGTIFFIYQKSTEVTRNPKKNIPRPSTSQQWQYQEDGEESEEDEDDIRLINQNNKNRNNNKEEELIVVQ